MTEQEPYYNIRLGVSTDPNMLVPVSRDDMFTILRDQMSSVCRNVTYVQGKSIHKVSTRLSKIVKKRMYRATAWHPGLRKGPQLKQ
jgi:hypothetical protein